MRERLLPLLLGAIFCLLGGSPAVWASADAELRLLRKAHERDAARIAELLERVSELEEENGQLRSKVPGGRRGTDLPQQISKPRSLSAAEVVREMEREVTAARRTALKRLMEIAGDNSRKGNADVALAVYRRVLEIDPKNREALGAIAKAEGWKPSSRRVRLPTGLLWTKLEKGADNEMLPCEMFVIGPFGKEISGELLRNGIEKHWVSPGKLYVEKHLGGERHTFRRATVTDGKLAGPGDKHSYGVIYIGSRTGGKARLDFGRGRAYVNCQEVVSGETLVLKPNVVYVLMLRQIPHHGANRLAITGSLDLWQGGGAAVLNSPRQ